MITITTKTATLTGSEKQITWADSIRRQYFECVEYTAAKVASRTEKGRIAAAQQIKERTADAVRAILFSAPYGLKFEETSTTDALALYDAANTFIANCDSTAWLIDNRHGLLAAAIREVK